MTISVVIPAYLEAENLVIILPKLCRTLDSIGTGYEILVIDTMEKMDNTKEICTASHVRYITRKGGNMYGDAIRTGFCEAEGDYIVVMDADGSHNPDDIVRFYAEIKNCNYDLVIGSRYCKGGNTENNCILRFMSWVLNVTYRVLFQLRIKDVSDSFRMYKASELKRLSLECDNFDIVEEILIKLKYTVQDLKVKEIPISFNKRAAGESKRNLIKFIKSYLRTICRLMWIKKKVAITREG